MNITLRFPARWLVLWLVLWLTGPLAQAIGFETILVPAGSHPAVTAAARIMAGKLGLPDTAIQSGPLPAAPVAGEIVLLTAPATPAVSAWLGNLPGQLRHDGYGIVFQSGAAVVYGARPRSLLYAAGDVAQWKDHPAGQWLRNPDFAIRTAPYYGNESVAEYVAALGVNIVMGRTEGGSEGMVTFKDTLPEVYAQLSPADRADLDRSSARGERNAAAFARVCHDADVEDYPFLYGNNFALWSPTLYRAVLKAYPSARGTSESNSWELATLCPSDPATWKVIDAYVQEYVAKAHGDGLCATFWDHYGLFCQDARCQNDGLNQFSNELYECVRHYHAVLAAHGQPLIMRTWASGVPHWLGDQWVHAPGYGNFGGEGVAVWGRVIRELPADLRLQTKVYNADCQPDPPFSPLLGQERPHPEIAEYQITGQTTGHFYFPASTVNHTAWTMKRSRDLVGPDGGVSLFPGGTGESDYSLFDDILNSINLYAWRELTWSADADVDQIWRAWATPIYGAKAAPHIIRALQLSEDAVNHLFSTLGLGSGTTSEFAGSIQRREVLLKYTNRYYQPDGQKALAPTLENVQRVMDEKKTCLAQIDEMFHQLELARPDLTPAQVDELTTRFEWLRQFAIVNASLEESLWRYRYLRAQAALLTTDPGQLQYLAQAYDTVEAHQKLLFKYHYRQQFSCYSVRMGDLQREPSLGKPMALMRELYQSSRTLVEASVGPGYLPAAWLR